jgi:hypothetical protein
VGVRGRTRIWGSSDRFGKGVIWDGLGRDIFGVCRGCIAGIPIGMKKRSHLNVLTTCVVSVHYKLVTNYVLPHIPILLLT